jgi:hypothetical protein
MNYSAALRTLRDVGSEYQLGDCVRTLLKGHDAG